MKARKILYTAVCLLLLLPASSAAQENDPQMDQFITNLMSRMTLKEKIGQLNLLASGSIVTGEGKNGGVSEKIKNGEVGGLFSLTGEKNLRAAQDIAVRQSRLKIPLIFGLDVIHGYKTEFPIPLASSCSWDMKAIENAAKISALEATADGICWTFSPMVDICRDGRWGRMAEGSGEDPYLGSLIARAMVRGYQGNSLSTGNTMMACIKHFALYGGVEAGREYNTVDMSRLRMFNEYLQPYEAAVKAGAGSVMTSFNTVDYIPSAGNKWLLTDLLRKQWGFKGFVVTDYTAIQEMVNHGVGKDLQEVSALALNAGTDMDMVSEGFLNTLEKSIAEGKVSVQSVDTACRRILEAKYKLGLFKDPYLYLSRKKAAKTTLTPANLKAARDIAAETFVLLKNDRRLLPLQKKGTIALIGPMAEAGPQMVGTWNVVSDPNLCPSLVKAMKESVGNNADILYAKGSNVCYDERLQENMSWGSIKWDSRKPEDIRAEALAVARKADVIVAAIGEPANGSGECSSRSDLTIFDAQKDLLQALKDTGKPVILVNFSGRPTVMTWEDRNFNAILNVWFGGTEAAPAICDVLFGDKVPSGHLSFTMPKSVGQIPIYYNHLNTGRPLGNEKWFTKFRSNYLDIDNEPLYPFGFGLSYTTFKYGPLTLDRNTMTGNDSIRASITVTNTGAYDGDEVVQFYIRDRVASISRPVEELKGFERIHLNRGESKTVNFVINADKLKFYNSQLQYVCEPGDFDVMAGPNCRDVQTCRFTLQ
ncbi:beta-glucosidase BglX [Segatella cerevisiae]|nr:beta-glucosidase BglX [Segatella cerevisiae]